MNNAPAERIDLDDREPDARFQRNLEHQFTFFMERMLRDAVPQPRAGGGPNPARMMETQVEKLANLKQFPTWDICLDIAGQFLGVDRRFMELEMLMSTQIKEKNCR